MPNEQETGAPRRVPTAHEFIDKTDRHWTVKRPKVPTKHIGGRSRHIWECEPWTFMVQSNLPEKVFVVQRLVHLRVERERAHEGGAQPGDREYRIGYYTLSPKNGRWTWGQYNPDDPTGRFVRLLEKARAEGTIHELS